MIGTNRIARRIVIVHWKSEAGHACEVFSSLKVFCQLYPQYSYNTLSKYLSRESRVYEDEQVYVERKVLADKASVAKRPALHKRLFWDMIYDKIDWQRSYRTIIQRIIERGTKAEWEELTRYYGKKRVIQTLKDEINYLPDHIIKAVSDYFHLKPAELKCYTRKQSLPQLWI